MLLNGSPLDFIGKSNAFIFQLLDYKLRFYIISKHDYLKNYASLDIDQNICITAKLKKPKLDQLQRRIAAKKYSRVFLNYYFYLITMSIPYHTICHPG